MLTLYLFSVCRNLTKRTKVYFTIMVCFPFEFMHFVHLKEWLQWCQFTGQQQKGQSCILEEKRMSVNCKRSQTQPNQINFTVTANALDPPPFAIA